MQGKHVLLGVTGSIASYKIALLIRLLVKAGAEVRVIMTSEATRFITPLTLSTLSKNQVYTSFEKEEGGLWNNHVELGLWADIYLIAPATASTISKMAIGLSDNLLVATYLSARCPVFFAPSMDLDMWAHPTTVKHCQTLSSYGNTQIGPENGELASGLSGDGRMMEPEKIFNALDQYFVQGERFHGKKVLLTAGPTQEPIDPVRYISNHSTGKMGYALAEAFAGFGANVILISGPTALEIHHSNIKRIWVNTAEEMLTESVRYFPEVEIAVLTAAVADYRPKKVHLEKIKSSSESMTIDLDKNPDIAQRLGSMKKSGQILGGFALETHNEIDFAQKKLKSKRFDFIVLNSMKDNEATFGYDTNKITILDDRGTILNFGLKPKSEVAIDIIDFIQGLLS